MMGPSLQWWAEEGDELVRGSASLRRALRHFETVVLAVEAEGGNSRLDLSDGRHEEKVWKGEEMERAGGG